MDRPFDDDRDDALRSTVLSAGALGERTASAQRSHDPHAPSAERDLLAAVIYYEGARSLFGADAEPPRLGKYTLERVLGSGAFGAVFLGHNPDTGGEVAIKVLRPGRSHNDRELRRLEREAQTLARLAHPNIVPVYDAGVEQGARYVVMRRSDGATLRDAQKGRPWPAILDLYVQAARGLAAVHAAGLLHRDFKADNVLVSADGQVMLADFGLVCLVDEHPAAPTSSRPSTTALAARLTRTGEVFGTPAYMSPEALENAPLDSRSDLFSLAASLYEALYGALPFEGDTLLAVYLAASQGQIRPRPARCTVPLWLDKVVRGALAAAPSRRPNSVDAFIAQLDHRARTRRRRVGLGLAATGLTGLLLGAVTMQPEDPCADSDARIAPAWSDRRPELAAAAAALSPQAGESWRRLSDLLEPYADAWSATFTSTCRATFHRAEQSQELYDARVACLDRRRRELHVLIDHLQPVSEEGLQRALEAAARLDPPAPCASATRSPSPTEAQRLALAPVYQDLARARILELYASDYRGAADAAQAALIAARKIGFAPAIAESLLTRARTYWLLHDGQAARLALSEALDLAEATALDTLSADATALLTKIAALELQDTTRGEEWARQSQRKLARIDADPWRRAEHLNNRGLLAFHLGLDLEAALEYHQQALALRRQIPGEARLLIAESHQNLGNVYAARGELGPAQTHYAASQQLTAALLGDDHPRLADDLYNRAAALREAGRTSEAQALAERALSHYLRIGVDGDIADAHILLSALFETTRQLPVGLAHAQLAAQRLARDPTAAPDRHARALERVGSLQRESQSHDAALHTYDRGLALLDGDDGRYDPERLALLLSRALTLIELQRFNEAHSELDRALRLALPQASHLAPLRAHALRSRGRAYLLERRSEPAIPPLEEALQLFTQHPDPPAEAETRYLLAKALVQADPEANRARAHQLARESLDALNHGDRNDDGEIIHNSEDDPLIREINALLDQLTPQQP